jgi:hypothetical protein
MKKIIQQKIFLISIVLALCVSVFPVIQEEPPPEPTENEIFPRKTVIYDPQGRRDPFRDLLGGSTLDEELAEGVTQMTINDVVLIGILEIKGELTGIVKGPQGFPYYIRKGDKFLDGYVLALDSYQITFRQTSDRGIPLLKPREIVKELFQEER